MNQNKNKEILLNKVESLLQQEKLGAAKEIIASLIDHFPEEPEVYKYTGWIAFKQNRLEEAEAYFLKAFQLDSNNPDYTYNLGWITFYQNKLEQAKEYYLKTIELQPDFSLPYINMGAIKYETGNLTEALNYYRKAFKLSPEDTHLINNLADTYTKLGQYTEAINTYEIILKLDPENARAIGNMGLAYKYSGDINKSKELCLQALSINPDSVNAHYNLANILLEQEDYQQALEEATKAKDLAHHISEPILSLIIKVKDQLGLDTTDDKFFLNKIKDKDPLIQQILEKNHYKVIDLLLERLQNDSKNHYYLSQLAYTLSQLGRYQQASDIFKYCTLLDESDPWVFQHYAFALSNINKKEEATKAYLKAIDLNPSLIWARKQLAELYIELDLPEKAEFIINKTIELTSENESGLLSNLFSLKAKTLEQHTPEEALDWYMLAVRYNEFESYNYERIAALLAIDYPEFVEDLKSIHMHLNTKPDNNSLGYCHQAIANFRLGNTNKSINFYKQAIKENIMYYPAYAGISQALYEKKYDTIQLSKEIQVPGILKKYVTNWEALSEQEQQIIALSTYPFQTKLEELVKNNYSITIVPIDTKITAYTENKDLRNQSYLDGSKYDGIRAIGGKKAFIGIERLRDLLWVIPNWLLQTPASMAHEFAHQVHQNMEKEYQQLILNNYKNCIDNNTPLVTDYAATNDQEFFAENYCQLVRNSVHKENKPTNINFKEFVNSQESKN